MGVLATAAGVEPRRGCGAIYRPIRERTCPPLLEPPASRVSAPSSCLRRRAVDAIASSPSRLRGLCIDNERFLGPTIQERQRSDVWNSRDRGDASELLVATQHVTLAGTWHGMRGEARPSTAKQFSAAVGAAAHRLTQPNRTSIAASSAGAASRTARSGYWPEPPYLSTCHLRPLRIGPDGGSLER